MFPCLFNYFCPNFLKMDPRSDYTLYNLLNLTRHIEVQGNVEELEFLITQRIPVNLILSTGPYRSKAIYLIKEYN